jgi:hypothetical protein
VSEFEFSSQCLVFWDWITVGGLTMFLEDLTWHPDSFTSQLDNNFNTTSS